MSGTTRTSPSRPVRDERLARAALIAGAALDRKARDLCILDVREMASFADTFILATGTSDRHVRSIADSIREALAAVDERPLGTEGYDDGRWVLLDLGDVIVHIFQEEIRDHYDLERLWGDAPKLDPSGDLGLVVTPEEEALTR